MKNSLSVGASLSHYRVTSKLGAGGMGEVYLAQDTKLDRKVALKVLPAEVASNRDRMDRFVREAKSAAALSHPNIAQVFEIGEDSGTHYIAMEFIDGLTLTKKIHAEQEELRKLLRYLQHVAQGLAKAHAAGIVHRDLKPDNIMITTDGHAKILDFGLAKLVEQTGQQPNGGEGQSEVPTAVMHSTPGVVMGTVGYMSPEQAKGKTNEIDQRSDIFSFGCILFEAATRQKPFTGDSVVKALHSLIYEPAPLIRDLNPTAPADLQRIVRRCLAKDRDERYQSIKEVAIELKELRRELETGGDFDTTVPPSTGGKTHNSNTGWNAASTKTSVSTQPATSSAEYVAQSIKHHKLITAIVLILVSGIVGLLIYYLRGRNAEAKEIRSIAVLPFQNKGADPDTEYLSDGLSESLIYRLSQVPNLKVSPTSSVIRYKGKEIDVAKVANELGVDAVMSGRWLQRGDNLAISVELVDARTNQTIWGDQYERKMSDLLATQREISAAIAQKLQLKLGANESKGLTKHYTDNNEAYQLYLKGRFYFAKRTNDDLRRSIEAFEQAIRLDPNFALAYVGKAESYSVMPSYGYLAQKDCVPQAKIAISKALELDPELPEAHTVSAMIIASYDWNWAEAEREFKQALQLDPNLALTHFRYAWTYLSPLGRHDEAIAEMKRAMELEPLSLQQGANFSSVYMYARKYDLAAEQAEKTLALDPSFFAAKNWLAHIYNMQGKYAEVIALSEGMPPGVQFNAQLGYAYAKSGRRKDAENLIARWKEVGKTNYVINYWIASTYAALGDKNEAFATLEKAYEARDWFTSRLKVDPYMDSLRDDPRFAELVKKVGLP